MSPLVLLLIGLAALVLGGELLVRGAVAAARRFGVSPLLIGLTLVGFGTSAPELVTSLRAALDGVPGIAVGNVVGSNIANILLIVGAAALVRPIAVDPKAIRRDWSTMMLATLAGLGALLGLGGVGRITGAAFVLALIAFVVWTYRQERADGQPSAELHAAEADSAGGQGTGLAAALAMAAGGLALVLLGAGWLVDGAVAIARTVGLSEAVIGLTVVAIGTSLPELTTALVAAARGHSDVALGNVIGSNVANLLGILGITGLVLPIPLPPDMTLLDLGVMLAAAVVLLPVALSGHRIGRIEGGVFLVAYIAYIAWISTGPAV
jgi:cation:H+ antiporter